MAFVPSSTLGSINANLGEFILGVIEQTDVTVRMSGSASVSFAPGGLRARGTVTCAASTSMTVQEGFQAYRLPIVRGPRYMKPPLGSVLDPASSRGLLLACLLNERAGLRVRNLVNGAYATSSAFSWQRNQFGDFIQIDSNNSVDFASGYDYGSAVSAAFMYRNDGGSTNGFQSFAFGRLTGDGGNASTVDWGIGHSGANTIVLIRTVSGTTTLTFAPLSTSRPVLVVLVYDGATLYAYQDGQLTTSTAINSPISLTSNAPVKLLGNSTAYSYAGYVWNRALTPAEILDLWKDPYWSFVYQPRRFITEKSATFNYLGQVECDSKASLSTSGISIRGGTVTCRGTGTASWTGTEKYSGKFECDGKGSASWTGSERYSGKFECDGKGSASWAGSERFASARFECDAKGSASWVSFTPRLGTVTCNAKGSAAWKPSVFFGSVELGFAGTATAFWDGNLHANGSLTCQAKASLIAEGRQPISGSWLCEASGTVSFLVGLDGVIFTCLTKGDQPTVVVHLPNFVF